MKQITKRRENHFLATDLKIQRNVKKRKRKKKRKQNSRKIKRSN